MKAFLILILFSNFIFAQHKDIYGLWHNSEGEYVRITENNDFVRFVRNTSSSEVVNLAMGEIKLQNKEMKIVRKDTIDSYYLCYYVGFDTMVICRPRSQKAWLWHKISN
ncbi:MAG: hypothetical protein CBD71_04800 [Rickettsiales bacterium TMED211]|nr:MAG: hypothetical protein CBD71_04800 [Rickettsiales bacterium TMED211]|tara:strand:+ start:282 stop:608 length:327 start_codon:yes stop_codon:yes gene_type:complete